MQENNQITTNKLLMRKNTQRFLNQAPRSSFKKLIVSMPSLLQGLHMMSLLKSVPEGLKSQEGKHTKLREPPPVPWGSCSWVSLHFFLLKNRARKHTTESQKNGWCYGKTALTFLSRNLPLPKFWFPPPSTLTNTLQKLSRLWEDIRILQRSYHHFWRR